jgi:hypothetical protein
MGCGCKNNNENLLDEVQIERKKTFSEKLNFILLKNDKFSLIGFLMFLLITPIALSIAIPFVVVILFTKLTFGKNIDLVKFITFVKDKKNKK